MARTKSRATLGKTAHEIELHGKSIIAAKVEKYESLTRRALNEIKPDLTISEKEIAIGKDFLHMAWNYFNDGQYFKKKGELLTALAAFSYAHAWLDAGVRARVFIAVDDQLFTLP